MSKAREGLNKLLEMHSNCDVVHVDHQGFREEYAAQNAMPNEIITAGNGPWTQISLKHDAGIAEYAIWNETGNVYETDQHGAVADDPFIWVTPFEGAV